MNFKECCLRNNLGKSDDNALYCQDCFIQLPKIQPKINLLIFMFLEKKKYFRNYYE